MNTAKQWCESVAALAVDALCDTGLVQRKQYEQAVAIVAEEIMARLCVSDYPPALDKDSTSGDEPDSVA